MQRRAAAIYAAFFILVAAGSYAVIGVAQQPTVTVDDPDHSAAAGDQLTLDGRTYTVGEIQSGTNEGNSLRSTELTWVNQSAQYSAEVANNSTVPPDDVQWEDQTARESATFENGSTVTVGGTDYQVVIAGGESPSEFTLDAGDSNQTYAVGDSLTYQGNQANVTQITSSQVTVVWGEPYRVLAESGDDPASFTFRQEFNVSKRLAEDPAVENETITRADGNRYVVYRDNGSTQPLQEYLPEPETRQFSEGDRLQYRNNETTVANVSNESVILEWTAPRTNTVSLEEGGTTTLGGTEYVAHFPDNSTLELTSDLEGYNRETAAVATYHERMNGFWGISILSGLAAILLLAAAYLPSRY